MNNYIKLLAVSILLFSCGKKQEEVTTEDNQKVSSLTLSAEQKKNAGIEYGEIKEQVLPTALKVTGFVDVPPIAAASISIPIGGYIKTTNEILPGKKVSKGEVLGTVTSLEYIQMQQDYLQAKSQAQFQTLEKNRQQALSAEEVGAKKRLQQAEADFGTLQAQVKGLAIKLDLLGSDLKALENGNIQKTISIKSPIDGYVSDQNLAIGKYVSPTDVLVKIAGVNHKHVELKSYEKDLHLIKIGQLVEVESEGMRAQAKVFLVSKQIDIESRTAPIHAHFTNESTEAQFTVGQFVHANILVGNQKVLTIPQSGFARSGKGGFIYVENGSGKIEQVPVEVLHSMADIVGIRPMKEIPAGKVIISGASALYAMFSK